MDPVGLIVQLMLLADFTAFLYAVLIYLVSAVLYPSLYGWRPMFLILSYETFCERKFARSLAEGIVEHGHSRKGLHLFTEVVGDEGKSEAARYVMEK